MLRIFSSFSIGQYKPCNFTLDVLAIGEQTKEDVDVNKNVEMFVCGGVLLLRSCEFSEFRTFLYGLMYCKNVRRMNSFKIYCVGAVQCVCVTSSETVPWSVSTVFIAIMNVVV